MVKAAVLKGVEQVEIMEFPKPKVAKDCALARVEVCGICGSDPHIYQGHLPVPYPIILGHEVSLILEEMGPEYPRHDVLGNPVKEGDRVALVPAYNCGKCVVCKLQPQRHNLCEKGECYGVTLQCSKEPHLFGGYAEYMYLYPEAWIYKCPEGMSAEVLALADPLAVGLRGLDAACSPGLPWAREGFGVGKTVLIQGLGTIGILTAAAAKAAGASAVYAIDGVKSRIDMSYKFGVDEVIDFNEYKTPEERLARVNKLTNGMGCDVVIELAGVPAVFQEAINLTRRGGKLIELGHYTDVGTIPINPQVISFREIEIVGLWAYAAPELGTAISLIQQTMDRFPYADLITHRYHIDEADQALKEARDRNCIKSVILGK
ncbi:5-exo-hydroxycamphor dehydrogenase [Pelotomaculum schinkii]|uniref:5-exo-hydroxycamphor dehydrogenase n=1 Tax=Pelotomaculum schinkii TaxID=78350 RepID=A0A4Y7R648_9FIRM|nr:zinc-binding dehydrogenase [Pelotomaculum schinkii]TEB04448.1 5-exo-hydroxycamphor dehydrogenase [Pelotomaculum schinkii]